MNLGPESSPLPVNAREFNPDVFDVNTLRGRYPSYLDMLDTSIRYDDIIDAIIVPTARPPESIRQAAILAKDTGSALTALCSHEANEVQVADILDDSGVRYWNVVNVPPGYVVPSVELVSNTLIPDIGRRVPASNLSEKRNIGMALGKMLGLQKLLFADDDVRIAPAALRNVSLMLNGRKIAGLKCVGHPDKAVVDHAEHEIVRHHSSPKRMNRPAGAGHISGNSIAVNLQLSNIFFPLEIYNEDLLAFYDLYEERSAALSELGYDQDSFDPFARASRASEEEFGEIVAHGLYQHLQRPSYDGLEDKRYWSTIISHRHDLIGYLLVGLDTPADPRNFTIYSTVPTFKPEIIEKIRNSLLAALAVNEVISPEDCVDYYRVWREDQARWQQYMDNLPTDLTMREASNRLGVDYRSSDDR